MRLLAGTLVLILSAGPAVAAPPPEDEVERVVTRHVKALLPDDGIGGAAVALRLEGRTLFFNYRWADAAAERPVTTDTLFNLGSLRKVFEATLLALAVQSGRIALDDRVADCLPELRPDRDISRITIGQLATHTSGLLLPTDHPPWPKSGYTLPQFIAVDSPARQASKNGTGTRSQTFIWLEDLIACNLNSLFPGMEILEAHPFHVTRDAEIEIQELEAGDLLANTEEGLRQRRFGDVVRLQVNVNMPANVLRILISNLEVNRKYVSRHSGPLSLSRLRYIAALEGPDLKDPTFLPAVPVAFEPEGEEDGPDVEAVEAAAGASPTGLTGCTSSSGTFFRGDGVGVGCGSSVSSDFV